MDFLSTPIQGFIACLLVLLNAVTTENSIVVSISDGQVQGSEYVSREGYKYFGFLGIPYGTVPARFEPPQPPPPWDSIFDATKGGPVCPQIARGSNIVIGDEFNCLVLNVFTPDLRPSGDLPVIVYFHGGAFMTGSGDQYGASYFVDGGIITVFPNYRLSSFGFLSTGDGVIQGNAGLKDQNLALRWVKANIRAFGGDPNRVTIMGESAGGASVSYHLLSPMSKGLFQYAISQSGTALDPEHFETDPLVRATELAESLYCPTAPTTALAECLRQASFSKLVQIKLTKWHLDPLVQYPPTIETLREGQGPADVFLAEEPLVLLKEGRFNRVPWVVGITEEEGLLFHSAFVMRNIELQRNMNENWNYVAPITFYYDKVYIPEDQKDHISRAIRGFYFGDRKVEASSSRNLTNLYSDRLFNWGTRSAALLYAKYAPVYTYIFGFLGDYTMLQLFYGDLFAGPIGTTHGDDLQYFFNSTRYPNVKPGSPAEEMSRVLINLWASFASTGNMMKSLETLKVAWLPIGPQEIRLWRPKWCYISLESKILAREPFTDRMEFWDTISNLLNQVQQPSTNNDDLQLSEANGREEL